MLAMLTPVTSPAPVVESALAGNTTNLVLVHLTPPPHLYVRKYTTLTATEVSISYSDDRLFDTTKSTAFFGAAYPDVTHSTTKTMGPPLGTTQLTPLRTTTAARNSSMAANAT